MGKLLAAMQKTRAQSAWETSSCAQLNGSAIGTTSAFGSNCSASRGFDLSALCGRQAPSVLAETAQSVFRNGSRAGIDLEELEEATHRVEAYLRFRDRKFDRQKLNRELSELNRNR